MSRAELQQSLIELLRTCALSGSDRSVDPSAPLGAIGLGLDSLAMVQFLTAVESTYKVQLPDDLWVTREHLSIDSFADEIMGQSPAVTVASQVMIPLRNSVAAAKKSPFAVFTGLSSLHRKVMGRTYQKVRLHVLVRDLTTPLPVFDLKPGFEFRRIAPGDSVSLGGLWPHDVREYKTQVFGRKLNSDVICLAVMDGKQVVALDWFSHHRAVERDLGIEVEMSTDVCFGYDLHEHPDYHSQGLGLALLSYTLKYARDLGYKRQYAIVLDDNVKMLSVATQLMGMKKVGQLDVARVLRKPFPRWNLNGLTGTRVLTLV